MMQGSRIGLTNLNWVKSGCAARHEERPLPRRTGSARPERRVASHPHSAWANILSTGCATWGYLRTGCSTPLLRQHILFSSVAIDVSPAD
jgi:hypothetical protein